MGRGRKDKTSGVREYYARHGQLLCISAVLGKTSVDRRRARRPDERAARGSFSGASPPPLLYDEASAVVSARALSALSRYRRGLLRAALPTTTTARVTHPPYNPGPVSDFPCFGRRRAQLAPRQLVAAEIRIAPVGQSPDVRC